MKKKKEVQQGTLALMVLKTLDVLGPLHGEGAVGSEWGASENNRRSRFYRLTRVGQRSLATEKMHWDQTAAIIARFFDVTAEELA